MTRQWLSLEPSPPVGLCVLESCDFSLGLGGGPQRSCTVESGFSSSSGSSLITSTLSCLPSGTSVLTTLWHPQNQEPHVRVNSMSELPEEASRAPSEGDSGLEPQCTDLMSPLLDPQSSPLLTSGLGSLPGNQSWTAPTNTRAGGSPSHLLFVIYKHL